MFVLTLGLVLWAAVHFVPSIGQPIKRGWIELLGQRGYTISFSIIVIISLLLIVLGWRSTTPTQLYALPDFVKPIAIVLMVIAFVLFGAAKHPTRIKRFVRHPQLVSIIVWSIAHLLLNGDSRSVLLFGWFGCWAILEIIAINRRDGEWIKAQAPSWGQEAKGFAISLVILIVAAAAHPFIAGVGIR